MIAITYLTEEEYEILEDEATINYYESNAFYDSPDFENFVDKYIVAHIDGDDYEVVG